MTLYTQIDLPHPHSYNRNNEAFEFWVRRDLALPSFFDPSTGLPTFPPHQLARLQPAALPGRLVAMGAMGSHIRSTGPVTGARGEWERHPLLSHTHTHTRSHTLSHLSGTLTGDGDGGIRAARESEDGSSPIGEQERAGRGWAEKSEGR